MTKEELHQLTAKFLNKTLSPEEKERLEQWYQQGADEEISINVPSEYSSYKSEAELRKGLLRQIKAAIANEEKVVSFDRPVAHRVHFLKTTWFRYAAAIILLIGGVAIWYKMPKQVRHDGMVAATDSKNSGIHPGGNKAVLTLSDGTKILLDEVRNGHLAQQGGTKVVKLDNGQLAYNSGAGVGSDVGYNTLSAPRGGYYIVTLPDGTKVWLNAASSIRYPTAFVGNERGVDITGEAYLEVAKNTKKPFVVHANGTEIQVLGTSFNVNAYQDESTVKTALVSGSVRVSKIPILKQVQDDGKGQARNDVSSVVLKPGELARAGAAGVKVSSANLEEVLAWKDGLFYFNRSDLPTVMRQLSRWYDVEVVYEGAIPAKTFIGRLPREASISQVLRALEKIGVHFRIEGKTIIVMS